MLAIGTMVVGGLCGSSLYAGLQKYRPQRDKRLAFLVDAPTSAERNPMSVTAPQSLSRDGAMIALTSATALIHVHRGLAENFTLLALNGVGYAGLLVGLYTLPQLEAYRDQLRASLFVYTGITIITYFLWWGTSALTSPIGMATKLIEAILMGALWLDRKANLPAAQTA